MSRRDPIVRLQYMRDYARKAMAMASGKTRADLDQDETFGLALARLRELIGEAASQVPPEFRENYPKIPWAKMIGMRNRLIHAYEDIDYNILWDATTVNLPQLLAEIETILSAEKSKS